MQHANILIADDDAVLRLDLRTMLSDMGHCVVGETDNGESACYMARSLHPDLIILDVMIPRRNGLEAAEIINQERLGPVILLTAYSEAPIIEQANKAGVLAYLVKPFREQELRATIAIAMSRYREMTALEQALGSVQEQIDTNRIVGRAKRVLMGRHAVGDHEAYRRLQAQALATSRSLREIADAILLTEDMATPVTSARRSR
jgi:response regulator NasT